MTCLQTRTCSDMTIISNVPAIGPASGWRLRSVLLALFLLLGAQAHAIDLETAKADGLIGERADGYLGIVVDEAPADVVELVDSVNAKRRQRYQQIAERNQIELADVEARAGQKAIEKTASGGWIFQAGWQQKP